MEAINAISNNSHESGCACCSQKSCLPDVEAIHGLACSGFDYMQKISDSQTVNTGNVINRYLSNLPEDKDKEQELFCLAITMLNMSKDKINSVNPTSYDKILQGLVKTYSERL
mgnify:CR=1 FL=1|tara:strand:- start:89 stop:427 length:339 start_codon:yes stop_codon:yes gene_type:complete